MKKSLLLFIGIGLVLFANAQTTIKGKVVDSGSGEELVGVNVIIKGTTTGTSTDANGNYSINTSVQDSVLEFTYIGYLSEEITIQDRTNIDVSLIPDLVPLDQVVVVGYGTQTKREITGAVSVVDVDQLSKSHSPMLTDQLQGRVAGVTVTSTGQPGSRGNIKIRGASFFGGNEPLYVVDGILTGDQASFNPNDVESVQVLRDASSTAIYGNRAANGVIIITTKKGQKGSPKINFSSRFGFDKITSRIPLVNNFGWAEIINEAHDNAGSPRQALADEEFNPDINTDWQDVVFSDNAPVFDANLSVSGGGKKSNVYFSVNYLNQDGTIEGPHFNRISTRLNSEYELGDKLTIGQHFTVGFTETTGVSGTDLTESPPFQAAFEMLPVIPVYDTAQPSGYGIGELNRAQTWSENPVGVMDMFKRFNEDINFTGDVFLDYNIIDGLDYRFSLGINSSFNKAKQYNEAGELRMGGNPHLSGLSETRGEGRGIFLENRLTYSKDFGKHRFSIMATHTEQKNDESFQSTSVIGGYDEEINFWQISGNSGSTSSSGQEFHSAIRSYLGRLTYNYNDKYFLTGIIRRDGSSNFAPENRWGTFPSISVGWDISQEGFFNFEPVNQLKLRAGYGEVGNASVGPYQYTTTIYRTALGADRWNPGVNYNLGPTSQSVIGATRSNNINNRNISWEELAETNIGLDIEAFNRQLFISGDYFFGEVNNVLSEVPVPGTIGAPERPAPAVNAVSLKRNGWELSVSYRKLTGDFQYSVTANVSHSKNEITDLGYGLSDLVAGGGKTTARAGYPAGKFYLLEYEGIYSQADIDALPEDFTIAGETPVVGDAKYRDAYGRDEEGNLTIGPDGKISLDDDRIIMGDPIAAINYGLNFDFSYKIFDLTIFFQGISGRDVYNSYYGLMNSEYFGHFTNYPSYYDPYMNGQGSDPRPIWLDGHGNNLPSTRFIENGAYLRLKNVQLGITIPSRKYDNLRLYLSGQNLLTFTKYRGLDPEFEGGIFIPGIDPRGYPVVRSISLGINFTF